MILNFEEFLLNEAKKKWSDSTHPYFKGLSKSTKEAKKRQMKKQSSMRDDDPGAYKEMPGDVKGKRRSKESKHTSKYKQMYGE